MYEIGQQVVCVKSGAETIEGKIYTISNMIVCNCKILMLEFRELNMKRKKARCIHCGTERTNNPAFYNSKRFRPIDDLYNTEIEELMNEVNERQPFK